MINMTFWSLDSFLQLSRNPCVVVFVIFKAFNWVNRGVLFAVDGAVLFGFPFVSH